MAITKIGTLTNNDWYRIKAECGDSALNLIEDLMGKVDELVEKVNELEEKCEELDERVTALEPEDEPEDEPEEGDGE